MGWRTEKGGRGLLGSVAPTENRNISFGAGEKESELSFSRVESGVRIAQCGCPVVRCLSREVKAREMSEPDAIAQDWVLETWRPREGLELKEDGRHCSHT